MKILTPGHLYELASFEQPEAIQRLRFIQKEQRDSKFVTVADGTTNEEVLRVLIDRLTFLNTRAPCRENSIAITFIETALLWLEKRTADRKARGVEGTPKI